MSNEVCREAVILAGGLGTRLRTEVPELPKCLAPVAGKPFLDHVVNHLKKSGVHHFIFSLGYRAELIMEHLLNHTDKEIKISLAIEDEPLGTGGAISYGSSFVEGDDFLALNGDSLFAMDPALLSFTGDEICVMGLCEMHNFNRYGTVNLDENGFVVGFQEKKQLDKGLINGGLYHLQKDAFSKLELPEKYSFEKDFLEVYAPQKKIKGVESKSYFIDIGVPEDYRKANLDLQ